jgi:tetratricopeptide (TPR) repeat protein
VTTHQHSLLRLRPFAILIAAVLLAAGTWVGQWLTSRTEPGPGAAAGPAVQAPAQAGPSIVEAPALDLAGLDDQIALWGRKAAANDNDYISATNLGLLYLGRARLTADLADYDRANQAVLRALDADSGYVPARALDAVVRYATHDFTGAVASAERLLTDQPGQVDALSVLADASLELGRLDSARATYARLAELVPGPSLDARLARLAYLSGDVQGALALARGAQAEALAGDVTDPAFFHYQLGELARLAGDAETAREAFVAALGLRPADRASLVGLAKVDAAGGRTDEAIRGLRAAAATAPEPATLALLGDLLAAADPAGAEEQYQAVRFTGRLGELAGAVYDRQLLLFELDHGGASAELLARAEQALAIRADAAGLDLVAWARHRLGDHDGARAAIDEARSTGIVDARIVFHAGAIAIARGDEATGRELLEQALALGPALDPIERAEAQRLVAEG